MAFFQSKTLRSTLVPSLFINRVLLMGITNHTAGRTRILGLIHSGMICVLYGVASFVAFRIAPALAQGSENSVVSFGHRIFWIVNFFLNIVHLVVSVLRNKDHDDCVTELMDIDVAIKEMGVARPYGPLLMQHILQLFASIMAFLTLCIWLFTIGTNENRFNYTFCMIIFFYQLLQSTLGDNTLCIFNRVMTERFEDLNSLLKSMRIKNANDYNTRVGTLIRVEAIFEDKEKLEKLRSIRKIYSRLDDLANRWIKLNEVNIVYTVIMAMSALTIQGYIFYCEYLAPKNQSGRISFLDSGHHLYMCIFHIVKLFIIVCPAAALTAEAKKTRGILSMHLQPIAFLRLEVQQFSWDLIQDPIRLSIRGMFDLDYTLIQMIFGSVVTYLVMLVQTRNL